MQKTRQQLIDIITAGLMPGSGVRKKREAQAALILLAKQLKLNPPDFTEGVLSDDQR